MLIRRYRVRLKPTKEQEQLFVKSCGVMRWAYNYGLQRKIEEYKKDKSNLSRLIIRKEIQTLRKKEEYEWISEVSTKVYDEALRDLDKAFSFFFKGLKNFPKYKTKKHKLSFYTRNEGVWFKDGFVNMEKIGKVKYTANFYLPQGWNVYHFMDTRVIHDGKYWYLIFGMEVNEKQVDLNQNLSIGIDLGVKELAVCSNGLRFKNINKTFKMKKLDKTINRLQRKLSKKYKLNDGETTNNIIKLERKIKLTYRKTKQIRLNYIHNVTRRIINLKPYRIVLEDLKVKNMIKNKYLSKAISEQLFYEFRRQIEYKSEIYKIEVVIANRWYPSSKTCSCCGNINKNLKLYNRVYKCEHCGLVIDRDLNASINLSNYKINEISK